MKLMSKRIITLIIFFLLSSENVFLQQGILTVDSTTGSSVDEEIMDFNFSSQVKTVEKSRSCLSSRVSFSFLNQSLAEVLKQITAVTDINFAYDDQILKINGINCYIENEPLYDVLDKILEPHSISFFEYEAGKVALAKTTRVNERTGGIKGYITDESGECLMGANVMIKELQIGCASNIKGFYQLKNIKPGQYTFEISFVGYEKVSKKIKITAGEILELNFTLKSLAFQIGGIEVVGTTELLPKDINTKTTITSGEIEHYQASSIKDVLDLVPGVQKTDNPGLSKTSQIAVRGDESDALTAFGTLIIVDGVPVSNNANLQFERLTGSKFGNSNLGRGVDLRTIPADNIDMIEVVTGLPSVRYGDVTAGVINVQTKIGKSPNRLKIKNNPDLQEGNLGGGIHLGEGALNYNFNFAQSERDVRKTGDEYSRITGQLVYSTNFFNNSLMTNNKIMYQSIHDEEEVKGDMQQTRNYNRGYTLTLSSWGKYKPDDGVSAIDYNVFTTIRRENTMKSKLNTEYVIYMGDTISSYIGKVQTKGIEWTIGARLEYNKIFYTGDFIHKFLIGIDPQYNVNTGEGVIFDTLLSYYGSDAGRRPYKFDDIPGQLLTSIYVEDKITGHFLCDFNLMLGFRYEMYRPYGFNLKGLWGDGDLVKSHQGSYFNPRINLMLYLSKVNQIRFSAGNSTKSPPMSTVYPPEKVFKWRNPVDSVIQHFRYDLQVPELRGYKETIFEFAYDHKFFNLFGITASAYYKLRRGDPWGVPVPVFSTTVSNGKTSVYYIDTYSISQNWGKSDSKGLEFTLRTARIKELNMDFQITGSYNRVDNPGNGFSYGANPDSSKGQYPNFLVPGVSVDTLIGWTYPSSSRWNDRFQLNYYLKYTLPALGLWITVRAEQLVFERNQNYNLIPVVWEKLNEDQRLDRLFDEEIKIKPNKWLFNVSMSKSLFKGAEISFYVNNFFDDPAIRRYYSSRTNETEDQRNPSLFYGIEFSMSIDSFFGGKDETD